MVKIVKQTMGKAEHSGEDPYCTVLAYRVTPRGPEKLSPAEEMSEHKFKALLAIKQHLPAKLTTSRKITLQEKQQQQITITTQHNNSKNSKLYQLVWVCLDPWQPI